MSAEPSAPLPAGIAAPLATPFAARANGWLAPAPLLTLLALWLLATMGLRPLLLPDEGRYAEVARAMLHGDWLVPTLNGLPFFHKPPLFYWLDIAAMQVFGETAFAARFGAMLGAWLMGASLLLAMRRWHGERPAAIALAVLATTPFFFVGAQYANHDMLVGGLITAAVLAFARAVDVPLKPALRWLVLGWAMCGLALLAKGLIGVVLPALVIGPWLLAQRRWRELLALLHPLGLLAFVAVAAPWCVAMQLRFPGFFDYFFVEQHFRRFAQGGFNNAHGAWFFVVLLPLMTLPWSAWLPAAVRRVQARADARVGLFVWWFVAVVGFFSIPSSKLVGYVLPALAPWCALLALPIAARPTRTWPRVLAVAALVCVALVAVTAWKAPQSNRTLATVLGARIASNDAVVMVDAYFYDVPFYARLAQPVTVASGWDEPTLPLHDNWRKELFDAARFDPSAGRALLQPLERLATLGCGAGSVWFVAATAEVRRISVLPGAERVFGDARTELWRRPGPACR